MPILIVGFIISILISIGLAIQCYHFKINKLTIDNINREVQIENKQIEKENKQLRSKKEELISGIQTQNDILRSLQETRLNMEDNAEKEAQKFYKTKIKEIEAKALERENGLSAEYKKKSDAFDLKIKQKQEELNNIEAKQLAYIQAQKRQEEIIANQDYYRLALDKIDLDDISMLRELQPRFSKKESIDKLIWEVYLKPAYDILMSHLFEGTKKMCGIYKITNLTTNQAYIGQSVDIRERFRQHIKTALSYSKATNILYVTMQKVGIENFTFEVLEEVPRDKLNEREIYWINFYKTKDYGLNSTRGNGQI